jgi:hypothetical protein
MAKADIWQAPLTSTAPAPPPTLQLQQQLLPMLLPALAASLLCSCLHQAQQLAQQHLPHAVLLPASLDQQVQVLQQGTAAGHSGVS